MRVYFFVYTGDMKKQPQDQRRANKKRESPPLQAKLLFSRFVVCSLGDHHWISASQHSDIQSR
jgi:hypothetical protein